MKREVEIGILKELMRQLDEKKNIDAGVMYRNPTEVYTSREIAERESVRDFLMLNSALDD